MKKRVGKTCGDCLHYSACAAWNIGSIVNMDCNNCVNFEKDDKWWHKASLSQPKEYRNECRELIPFLVCVDGTDYPFRAFFDGKNWGDGISKLNVKYWMPLPEPPKEAG